MGDGLSDWYKLRRLRELEEEKSQREIEGTEDSSKDTSQSTVYLWHESPQNDSDLEYHNYEPPVFEQMWKILSKDARDKIKHRFELCLVGTIAFWLGVWMGHP